MPRTTLERKPYPRFRYKNGEEESSGNEEMGERNERIVQEEGEGDDVIIDKENDTEVVVLHVSDAQPRVIEHAQCESLKEKVIREQQNSMGGEAREREYSDRGRLKLWIECVISQRKM
jgi:hypothetical protein